MIHTDPVWLSCLFVSDTLCALTPLSQELALLVPALVAWDLSDAERYALVCSTRTAKVAHEGGREMYIYFSESPENDFT